MELTSTEKSCIRQLHLQGYWNAGKLIYTKRIALLLNLQLRGMLDDNAKPTKKGIAAAK